MSELLEAIKKYFTETPKEILDKDWEEKKYLDEIGPTVDEYIEWAKFFQSEQNKNSKLNNYNISHSHSCDNCPNNPKNNPLSGGVCFCTLGLPKITYKI